MANKPPRTKTPLDTAATPAEQVHLVAALLASGLGNPVIPGDEDVNVAITARVQRYRQLVRILSRSNSEGPASDQER